ncbi:DeoR/GlpR family DNA-binding transcription regulator [Paenibacillus spongiae]|uniref:Lactose phosphotransferase system repressor n=1 Tax=Paenibacillus spongiae TaxID=2909671 RepID=A0ABY5SLQ6_9BACL|nr:DeoR/GlpR family DNA-binding transcription regulator [Paenibacillus spongiae]UVI33450.1 DeoR/GlpR family DNA-binding transcription regulator [Paenibacillus spongiae]
MLKEERHHLILDLLNNEGKLIATELSSRLNVSEDTIRRDLRELDGMGVLHRVHGGALLKGASTVKFEEKFNQAPEAKTHIAEVGLKLIRNDQVIIIDGGTTTLTFAQQLPFDLKATVITNSPPVAVALSHHPNIEVVMLGGRLFKESLVNTGIATIQALEDIRADIYFMGTHSVHPQTGISIPDQEEAFIKRKMVNISAETVVLAEAHKLGTASTYVAAHVNEISYLVTESCVSSNVLIEYEKLGITVLQ